MAKVKTAKQRITDFMKAKGLDAAEIKDAFDELDAADMDLEKLADATVKNQEWLNWYQQVTPALNEIVSERDSLKQQIAKLQQAGLTFSEAQEVVNQNQPAPRQNDFDPNTFRSDLIGATNSLVKDATRYGFRHFKTYNEELDIDAIEKLMTEKKVPFEVAYGLYETPKREERMKKEMQDKIAQGIKEGMQAELSKQGIRKTRKRTDDVENAPLDKPAPSDSDLKEAFLRDLDAETTH